jgi:hypothetical protein
MKTLIIPMLIASLPSVATATDKAYFSPEKFTTPPGIYAKAEAMLKAKSNTRAKLFYSDALKELADEGLNKHAVVIAKNKTLLSNVYSVRVGSSEPNMALLNICYSMTSLPILLTASDKELNFRSSLYDKCLPVYQGTLGLPMIEKNQLTFDLATQDILAFDDATNTVIVGDKATAKTSSIVLQAEYPDAPLKLIFTTNKVDERVWKHTQTLFPNGVSDIGFRFSENTANVEVVTNDSGVITKTVLSLGQFMNLKVEVRYGLVEAD